MKGVILAGGSGSRLRPLTNFVSKQLLPIYDKPLIYYPITTLMLAGIRRILIVCNPEHLSSFQQVLGTGEQWGIQLEYQIQTRPKGIADGIIVSESFIDGDSFTLILGDNLFYGTGLGRSLKESLGNSENSSHQHFGSTIFTYSVSDPTQYGVVSFDSSGKIDYLEEKPENPRSNFAVTGLYVFDSRAVGFAKELKSSSRGELEILDVLKKYQELHELNVVALGRGTAWLDTGTFNNLYEASTFIKILQDRQGVKIGDPHEAATVQGWIES
jgi:glucose-1-phosphate thymidylyltransferase